MNAKGLTLCAEKQNSLSATEAVVIYDAS